MDTLERLGDHCLDAQEVGTLCSPVARRTVAIFNTGEDDQWNALFLVFHRRIVNRHLFLRRIVDGVATFLAVRAEHVVADADIGEGAAHHHFMVATARAVLVEVGHGNAVLRQIGASRRSSLDRTGRRNMVGGDLVAEETEDARALDVLEAGALFAHADEIGRVLNIGGLVVPGIGLARRNLNGLPVRVTLEHVSILGFVELTGDVFQDEFLDFLGGRPDILEIDGVAVLVVADRLLGQILLDRAGKRIGHDERRRGQIVRLHVRRDAAFEVAVTRENA
ncbi:hypothetical protein D3C71_1307820 [compost metagenome]